VIHSFFELTFLCKVIPSESLQGIGTESAIATSEKVFSLLFFSFFFLSIHPAIQSNHEKLAHPPNQRTVFAATSSGERRKEKKAETIQRSPENTPQKSTRPRGF